MSMVERMKVKHNKYKGSIKNMNMVIVIIVVLDPWYKL